MSAILHRRLHGHSSHLSSTSQHHQFRIHRLTKETMASVRDQLQCCLLAPKTNENKNTTPTTHTRSKTETDEALSESTQNQGRLFQLIRILQWKINASDKQNCHQPQLLTVQNHIRGIKVLNTNTLMHQAKRLMETLGRFCF